MSRRPTPRPPRSAFITAEGRQRLEQEYQRLWSVERPKLAREVGEAAALGDRSENAEYIYRKKELREIDRRIRYLQKRMPDLKVVTESPAEQSRVFFGAWVTLEDSSGQETEYRIVGPDEFDPAKAYISMDSPLAQALLKKAVDDEVEVKLPGGLAHYFIVKVRYRSAP